MSTEVSPTTTLTALHVTEKLGIPAFPALLQPYLDSTGCFPAVMMPHLPVGEGSGRGITASPTGSSRASPGRSWDAR
jgi:hypothetical protein